MNKKIKLNQRQAVLAYMRSQRKAKLTTAEITKGVNKTYGRKYTSVQVSKCLNKFKSCENPLVSTIDRLWSFNKSK